MRLSLPVQTGTEAEAAFCKMDAIYFQEVKQLQFGDVHPTYSRAVIENR
jgi:hypothetical protein